MKRTLLISTALSAVLAQGAFAADLPTKKGPPPAPAPVYAPFSWTGFYIGANVGGLWSSDGVTDLDPFYYGEIPGNSNTLNPSGVVGGLQAGYNYQIQQFVLGVEGDVDWSSASGKFSFPGAPAIATHSTSLPFFADLRGRAGYAFDRFLPYLTGGVVFANVKNNLADPDYGFSFGRGGESTGWTVGAGLEYAIDNHWSVKGEYLYMQFPDVTKTWDYNYSFKFKDSAQVARVGLNYRF
jgi:outer membrane immunogenic protein